MRLNRALGSIACWTLGVLLLCALAPEALADGELPVSSSWAPAAVLGLMLLTAARERR